MQRTARGERGRRLSVDFSMFFQNLKSDTVTLATNGAVTPPPISFPHPLEKTHSQRGFLISRSLHPFFLLPPVCASDSPLSFFPPSLSSFLRLFLSVTPSQRAPLQERKHHFSDLPTPQRHSVTAAAYLQQYVLVLSSACLPSSSPVSASLPPAHPTLVSLVMPL